MPDPKLVFVEPGDFGINRVGQRVRCIMPVAYTTDSGQRLWPGVVVGTEYTVDSFLECQMTEPHSPGLELKEIATPTCACCGRVLSFPIFAFRPVVGESFVDRVGELKELAAKQSAQTGIKVPLGSMHKRSEAERFIEPDGTVSKDRDSDVGGK